MVLIRTDGIESVLQNHTRTRGPSVACMRDFFSYLRPLGPGTAPRKHPWTGAEEQGSLGASSLGVPA